MNLTAETEIARAKFDSLVLYSHLLVDVLPSTRGIVPDILENCSTFYNESKASETAASFQTIFSRVGIHVRLFVGMSAYLPAWRHVRMRDQITAPGWLYS